MRSKIMSWRISLVGEPATTSPEYALKHDPEKWIPVFGKDHAQT
jgi:hypothetical protein